MPSGLLIRLKFCFIIKTYYFYRYDSWALEQQAAHQVQVKQELIDSPSGSPSSDFAGFQWNLDDVKNLPQEDFNPFAKNIENLKKKRGRPKKALNLHEPKEKLSEPKAIVDSSSSSNSDDGLCPEQVDTALDCPKLTRETNDWEPRHSDRIRRKKPLKRKEQDMPVLQPMKKIKQEVNGDFDSDEVPSSDADSDIYDFLRGACSSSSFPKSIPKEDIYRIMNCRVVLDPLPEKTLEELFKKKAGVSMDYTGFKKQNDSNDLLPGHDITDKFSLLSTIKEGVHKFVKEYNRKKGIMEPFDSSILDSLNQEPEVQSV